MAVKESSDELNPTLVLAEPGVARPRRLQSCGEFLSLAIATCGVGYLPIAPGTWGSLLAVGIYLLLQSFSFPLARLFGANRVMWQSAWPLFMAAELVLITLICLVGVWAASRAEVLLGRKDPRKVVIDEVGGQLIALLPVLPGLAPDWLSITAAFVFFRLFDIIKPYPARRLESLESGFGIMADDIVAGTYAAFVVGLVVVIRWFI